jgi:hypothetical protein
MDKKRLLEGRKAIVKYRKEHQDLHDRHDVSDEAHDAYFATLCNELGELGFKDEAEFEKFNKEMCYKEFRRCFKRIGVCDGCKDRLRGCLRSCFSNLFVNYHGLKDKEDIKGDAYELATQADFERGTVEAFDTMQVMFWKFYPGYVPPGCSVHFEQVAEPEFDWRWDFKNLGKYDGITNIKT